MSKTQYHVIAASGEYEDYHESPIYIFDDKEQAISKAKELYKEDEQWVVESRKKLKEIAERLCKKYGLIYDDEEYIIEGLSDFATEEEYQEYDDLWFDLNCCQYDNTRYYVYEYEIDDNGHVGCKGGFFDLKEKDNE